MDEENINYSTNDAGLDNQPVGMEPINTEPVVESMNAEVNVEPVNDEVKTELVDVKDNNIEPASVEAESVDSAPMNTEPIDAKTEPELNNDGQEIKFDNSKDKKSSKVVLLSVVAGILTVILVAMFAILPNLDFANKDISKHSETTGGNDEPIEEKKEINLGELGIRSNGLEEFDLAFLKLENNNEKNIVYSPLSIKYALAMLNEGADGNSREQIKKVLGYYNPKKYINSENISLANAAFINEVYKDKIKEDYSVNLQTKYGAELIFDSLESPNNINTWVNSKTFGLIDNIVQETNPTLDYLYLINALAIDMEWKQTLGVYATQENIKGSLPYNVSFEHIKSTYNTTPFIDSYDKGAYVAATANRYDIIKELGEDAIRETVQTKYNEWAEEVQNICSAEEITENAPDLNEYVEILSKHYGHLSSSTDFDFYASDDVIAFAKDLKEYDGTTFQYIGVMPKNKTISEYMSAVSAANISEIVKGLKSIKMESFKDGVITILSGHIPFFSFSYDLDLVEDLKNIGIIDIFSDKTANLSKIGDIDGLFITNAVHKAKIDFSNEGIKAGASTALDYGRGGANPCRFGYDFEAPIERIELKFDNPYIFLIRDKSSGEVWFTGLVRDPQQKAE